MTCGQEPLVMVLVTEIVTVASLHVVFAVGTSKSQPEPQGTVLLLEQLMFRTSKPFVFTVKLCRPYAKSDGGGSGGSAPGSPVLARMMRDWPMRTPLPTAAACSKVGYPPPQAQTRNWANALPIVFVPQVRVPPAKMP